MKKVCYLLLIVIISGCATITQGTKEEVMFTSKPDSTEVWVSGKKIGYTPTSAEISTFGRKEVTLIYPNGTKAKYVLKKTISPAVLLNLLLVAPELCLIGIGTDIISGGGWTFVDKKVSKKLKSTINKAEGNEVTLEVQTEPWRIKPELYLLLSGGGCYGKVGESGDRKNIVTGDLYFETILSLRDILHFGIGGNYGLLQYKKNDNVTYYTLYFLFKGAPKVENINRGYVLLHLGGGDIFANNEEPFSCSRQYFYIAFGVGMDLGKKIYAEILIKGISHKCPKMPTESIGLKVGFRLPNILQ
ncbi:MAG: hypothetical protein JW794_04970 [Candidatus Cloacimonetes bacterium]|nr:hypothetical protein [Candidatus Cloacimonadota bacterium]